MKFQRNWKKWLKIIPDALLCSSEWTNPKLNWCCCLLFLMYATRYILSIKTISSFSPAPLSMERLKSCPYCKSMFRPSANVWRNGNEIQSKHNENVLWAFECMQRLIQSTYWLSVWLILIFHGEKCCEEGQRSWEKLFSDSPRSTLKSYQKARGEWMDFTGGIQCLQKINIEGYINTGGPLSSCIFELILLLRGRAYIYMHLLLTNLFLKCCKY